MKLYAMQLFSLITVISALCVVAEAKSCVTARELHFDNAQVKSWTSTVCPGGKLDFHTHQYPRVAIAKQSGQLQVIYDNGAKQPITFVKNVPVYLSREQGLRLHADRNEGEQALEITVVEMKMPAES